MKPTTLPTVTVTPLDPSALVGNNAYWIDAPEPAPCVVVLRVPDGWKHTSSRHATHENLYQLIDEYMSAHGHPEYLLDASAVRSPA